MQNIFDQAGKQFDPEVVKAFDSIVLNALENISSIDEGTEDKAQKNQ
jgi:HD-GYP domain-containing protein (c-di-GMP phosphodiesterase class II)